MYVSPSYISLISIIQTVFGGEMFSFVKKDMPIFAGFLL